MDLEIVLCCFKGFYGVSRTQTWKTVLNLAFIPVRIFLMTDLLLGALRLEMRPMSN